MLISGKLKKNRIWCKKMRYFCIKSIQNLSKDVKPVDQQMDKLYPSQLNYVEPHAIVTMTMIKISVARTVE